ncbi:TonB-dependent receptor [Amphritea atlantica]|uniref:TonB-dependent receptor n=1 Tax=Amphritea atlantica TaxID=355243 RepID=A0ABY5H0G9_9GAMM|nr:TonB-dependent receptor [Amphritea atlantica]
MDRKFVFTGLIYAVIGMSLGIFMAASHNHEQMVTHAHIMLAGFVVSFIYALCHKLWLGGAINTLKKVQFYVHQIGIAVLFLGLFLLYGGFIPMETIDPVLALASFFVLAGMIMMLILFIKSDEARQRA